MLTLSVYPMLWFERNADTVLSAAGDHWNRGEFPEALDADIANAHR